MLRTFILALFLSVPINGFAGEPINAPADEVFQAALEMAMDMEAFPSQSNEKLRYFKTDPVKMKLTMDECDCGSMFGIPYLKDKRTVTEVTYKVRVKKVGEASELEVKTSIEGYYDESKNAISNIFSKKERDKGKVLDCKSLGVIEKKFIDSVRSKF